MSYIPVKDFSLKHSLECGQFFRYKKINDFYYVHSRDILFKVKQQGSKIYYKFADNKKIDEKNFLIDFFRLNDNLKYIEKELTNDKHLKTAFKKYKGLRLIRQNPWECAISFLCSSASNIPKIQMNIELLSKYFGKPIELDGYKSFTFPEFGKINNLEKIKKCKVGFRAEFILEANRNLKNIDKMKNLPFGEARIELMGNKGIGKKIADCICLFSLGKDEAFPVDTWVKRAMKKLYNKDEKEIEDFVGERFGKNAGYAQQYLFYMTRER